MKKIKRMCPSPHYISESLINVMIAGASSLTLAEKHANTVTKMCLHTVMHIFIQTFIYLSLTKTATCRSNPNITNNTLSHNLTSNVLLIPHV